MFVSRRNEARKDSNNYLMESIIIYMLHIMFVKSNQQEWTGSTCSMHGGNYKWIKNFGHKSSKKDDNLAVMSTDSKLIL
jgi:hypothetical protein